MIRRQAFAPGSANGAILASKGRLAVMHKNREGIRQLNRRNVP